MCGDWMLYNLKRFREELELTQEQMAESMGVSKSYYIKVEEGYRNPSYNFLKKFKCRYAENLDDIFFEFDNTQRVIICHKESKGGEQCMKE